MENFRLSKLPISFKMMASVLLCMVGLMYISLLFHIWIDTQMKPSLVIEAYGKMEYSELAENTVRFLPYYTIYLFTIPIVLFMFSSYSEKLKIFFGIFPLIIIIIDISSMWLIPYLWNVFAYILWLAGTCLALTFSLLFILILYDIWLKKEKN